MVHGVGRFRLMVLGAALAGCLMAFGVPQPAHAASSPKKTAAKTVAAKKAPARAKSAAVVAKKPEAKKPANRVAKPAARGKPKAQATAARAAKPRVKVQMAKGKPATTMHKVAVKRAPSPVMRTAAVVHQPSVGEALGLGSIDDPLALNSRVALVIDQETHQVLFSKNDSAVLPIASLTKLMTGLVIADAKLDMDAPITITRDDVDTYKGSRSRLAVGSTLSRRELMHLALMSSENRAAHALGRTYPGGLQAFVRLMNQKAAALGMADTHYVEPTGLSSENRSSARDLATLVSVAYQRPILRDLSTSPAHEVDLGRRTLQYNNSNRLIRNPDWDIGLQKTGYISEAGRCLVMQATVAGRQLIMVFLDSDGTIARVQDAERVRRWVETQTGASSPLVEQRTPPRG